MPRKKKSKLTRMLDAIEKTLADHANEFVHEDNKKKRVKSTRKRKTTTVTTEDLLAMWKDAKKDRPIDF